MNSKALRYLRFDPFEGLKRMQEDFGDFLWDTVREVSSGHPPMNIWYDTDKAILEAELPSVKKEDLEIEVLGNNITIKGSRKLPEDEQIVRQERTYGSFSRNVQLPFEVNPEGVEASLSKGILTITLPRKEEEKPKKVQVSITQN